MYTPITWAEPDKLKHLREKRTVERSTQTPLNLNTNNSKSLKNSILEVFTKPLGFAKTMKVSLSS